MTALGTEIANGPPWLQRYTVPYSTASNELYIHEIVGSENKDKQTIIILEQCPGK